MKHLNRVYIVVAFSFLMFILVACTQSTTPSPSEKQNTVQPKVTLALISTTQPPTETLIPSLTPAPTKTHRPTDTPQPNLENLVISYEEINSILPGYYSPSNSKPASSHLQLASKAVRYIRLYPYTTTGELRVELRKFEDEYDSFWVNFEIQEQYLDNGKLIKVPGHIKLPSDAWLVQTEDNQLILGVSYKEMWAIIYMSPIIKGFTGETASGFMFLLGQKQLEHFINDGYK